MRIKPRTILMVLVIFAWILPRGAAIAQDPSASPRALPISRGMDSDEARVKKVLHSKIRPVCDDGSRELQGRRLAGEKAPAALNAIILMCDFSDSLMLGRHGQVPGDFPPPMQTDRYYAAHDSVFFQHLLGDVADYYDEVSGGKLTVNATIHPRTINLPDPMRFYGNHPELGDQQILLAATVVDSLDAEIHFPDYDTVILVHAGAGEETDILGNSPEQIFSTYLDPDDFFGAMQDSILDTPYIPALGYPAGRGIDRVLVLPETEQQDPVGSFNGGFGSLGVYCFEVGLHLGMLSLSDFTPSGRPDSQGIGEFGLMGYGLFVGLGFIPPHPCAYNKYLMGWLEPYEAEIMAGSQWRLTPSERPSEPAACARVNLTGQEYWLLEYRLQDPNGDRRFSFSGDLNGNGLPDFWDADSDSNDGTPTGKFDPETDVRERVTDAEWDFAMSENNARGFGELAAGSGIYVWHIDEGVIQDVWNAPGNLFNADPARKSVDLEEADKIQDLDSSQPSDFMLGGDDDSFRAEDADHFDARTLPPTDTAGGARTGIAFREFSEVVLDSQSFILGVVDTVTYYGYEYADTMTFTLTADMDPDTGPVLSARRDLPPGTDLTGSHVLVAPLDPVGSLEQIILAGHQGEVFVLDGELNEFLDHDGDPATLAPFATGMRSGEPVVWNLPPAAGDLDYDGEMEIILTGPRGIYAFKADASPVRFVEVGADGLYQDLPGCSLPPILLSVIGKEAGADSLHVSVCVVVEDSGTSELRIFSGPAADPGPVFKLGPVLVPATPVAADGLLLVAVADTSGGNHHLVVLDQRPLENPGDPVRLDLPLARRPGPFPVSWGMTPESSPEDPVYFAIVVDGEGHGETVFFDGDLFRVRENIIWSEELEIRSPLAVGGAFVGSETLGRAGHGGHWQAGWPRRPLTDIAPVELPGAGSPLVAELVDASHALNQYIFPTRDGRLYGMGTKGEFASGWPLGAPSLGAGSPALGQLTGDVLLDLAAIGSFERIQGVGTDSTGLDVAFVSAITVWRDVAQTGAVWPMSGGSPRRNGSYDAAGWTSLPVAGQDPGLVAGSHYCYPSPLLSGPLYVSGQVGAPARVRAFVYNLQGEEILSTGWQDVAAVEPFAVEVGLDGVVTGLYLCRLVVESDGGATDNSVVQFAVVR